MCRGTPCAGSGALGEPRSFHDSAAWKGALARLRPRRNWFGLAEIIPLLSSAGVPCSRGALPAASVTQALAAWQGCALPSEAPLPGCSQHGTAAARITGSTWESPGHPRLTWAPPALGAAGGGADTELSDMSTLQLPVVLAELWGARPSCFGLCSCAAAEGLHTELSPTSLASSCLGLFAGCRGMLLEHSRNVGKDRSTHLPSSCCQFGRKGFRRLLGALALPSM